MDELPGLVRIGELGRRTGVSPELLRAWEQRYGLLRPIRSAGGFRLYSPLDEARVRRTTELIRSGMSAAEAAGQALQQLGAPLAPTAAELATTAAALRSALDAFDVVASHEALDQLLAQAPIEIALREVVVPYLRTLGDRWADGTASVAQEHFASQLLRGRLLALARGWGGGSGPSTVLACLPGERHDLGLIIFGLLLGDAGWQITFLGADTPLDTIADAATRVEADLVVLLAVSPQRFQDNQAELPALTQQWRVAIAGGMDPDAVAAVGALALPADLFDAAHVLLTG